jgi:hypothetical protein
MRGLRTRIAVLAVAAMLPFGPAAQAGPEADGPGGPRCSLAATINPNAAANTQTGTISGTVYAFNEANIPQSGTLTCTVQVGLNTTHASADAPGGKVSASGSGAVTIPPSLVSYTARPYDDVWLCAQFTYTGGGTVYWHNDNDDDPTTETGHWTADANSACQLGVRVNKPDEPPFVREVIEVVEGPLCRVLKLVLPPDGDVARVWDCPPYNG